MAGRSRIAQQVAQSTGLSQEKATELVDAVFQSIAEQLSKGERVTIRGFGRFDVRQHSRRQGYNPATGETVAIPARKNVGFRVGRHLKLALQGKPTIDYPTIDYPDDEDEED